MCSREDQANVRKRIEKQSKARKNKQCKTTLSEQASVVLSKANTTINVLTTSTQQKYIVMGLAFPERLLGILLGILRVDFWGIPLDDHWDQIYLDTDEVEKILENQANAKRREKQGKTRNHKQIQGKALKNNQSTTTIKKQTKRNKIQEKHQKQRKHNRSANALKCKNEQSEARKNTRNTSKSMGKTCKREENQRNNKLKQ